MQDTYRHMFTTEPIVIRTGNQASRSDDVMEGDVIVSVEGALITSREGGLRLGSLPIGEPADLQVRRGDRLMTLEVVPEGSCELPRLLVSSELPVLLANSAQRALLANQQLTAARLMTSQAPEASLYGSYLSTQASELTPPVEFGIELSCGDCAWTRSGSGSGWSVRGLTVTTVESGTGTGTGTSEVRRRYMRFVTEEFPVIRAVEKDGPADAAGVQIGDIILTVDGMPITSREAGQFLGEVEAGSAVTLELRRGNQIVSIDVVPRAATEKRQKM
jgi:hypothetical protein